MVDKFYLRELWSLLFYIGAPISASLLPAAGFGPVQGLLIGLCVLFGAHANPVVTGIALGTGSIQRREASWRFGWQAVSAIIAAMVLAFTHQIGLPQPFLVDDTLALAMEVMGSLLLGIAALLVVKAEMPELFQAVTLGGVVGLGAAAIGNFTGGSLNPARWLSSALAAMSVGQMVPSWWVYILSGLIAVAAVVLFWRFVGKRLQAVPAPQPRQPRQPRPVRGAGVRVPVDPDAGDSPAGHLPVQQVENRLRGRGN